MGTYTTNKNLYMPTVGEQGWGTLVNNNFSTIDTFLKPISLSGSTYTFTGNQTGGSVSATSISNGGTLTSTGKITANGGIGTTSLTTSSTITSTGKITGNGGIAGTTGTFSGAVTGASGTFNYITLPLSSNGSIQLFSVYNGIDITASGTFTSSRYYIPNTGSVRYTGSYTATITCTRSGTSRTVQFYKNGSVASTLTLSTGTSKSVTIYPGENCYFYMPAGSGYFEGSASCTAKI